MFSWISNIFQEANLINRKLNYSWTNSIPVRTWMCGSGMRPSASRSIWTAQQSLWCGDWKIYDQTNSKQLMAKPSLPATGTQDFLPHWYGNVNYILSTIRERFWTLPGFQAAGNTSHGKPAETLMGKYGEEGDKLILKSWTMDWTSQKDAGH